MRASVESYSIKMLEPFYGFARDTSLADANIALANLQAGLELDDIPSITEETKATVLGYNRDDCRSAAGLRDWLEELRGQLVAGGTDVPRPVPGDGAPNEKITDWLIKINALIEKLTADVPADPEERERRPAGALAACQHPRLAPPRRQGGVVGVFPARRSFRRRSA